MGETAQPLAAVSRHGDGKTAFPQPGGEAFTMNGIIFYVQEAHSFHNLHLVNGWLPDRHRQYNTSAPSSQPKPAHW